MKRGFTILSCLVLLSNILSAQRVIFKTYTVQDGLVANQVRRIIQDSLGFIWIATWEGLSKYDGHKFTNYHSRNGLSFNMVNDIFEGSDQTIFVAENDGSLDRIRNNEVERNPVDKLVINRFIRSKDKVYTITDKRGITQFEEGRVIFKPGQPIRAIMDFAELNDSLSVIFNSDYKPQVLDSSFHPFSKPEPEAYLYTAIAKDTKNNVWLCGYGGLRLLDPIQERNKPMRFLPLPAIFQHPIVQANKEVLNLFQDIDGNYWLSTTKGLIRISPNGKAFLFNEQNGLPALVNNLFQDREKNIWMGSQLGLIKLVMQNDMQYFFQHEELLNNKIVSIVQAEDQLFYVTNGKVILKVSRNDFSISQVLKTQRYIGISPTGTDGKILVLSLSEVSLLENNGTASKILFTTDSNNTIYSALQDASGNLYIGSTRGLDLKIKDRVWHCPDLPYRITTLTMDQQEHLWVGTWVNGLYRIRTKYVGDSIAWIVENMTSLLPDNSIRSSYKDKKGNLWIGTRYAGAARLCPLPGNRFERLLVNQKQGLNSNWANAFAEDKNGNVWIGTYGGLNKLIPTRQGYRVFDFSKVNNFFGEIVCISLSEDGIVWCGGYPGLVRFKDNELDSFPAPPTYITAVNAGISSQHIEPLKQKFLSLPYRQNAMYFEFSAPGFINEKSILYSYRLSGAISTKWSTPSNQHSVTYASIEPGEYTFEVRAYGWNGLPGKSSSYSFAVNPPFWQKWWFFLAVSLLAALVLYAVYRYRVSQIIKWQRARDRIATDLHDDIGSTLTNISILSELSSRNIHEPEQAEKFLQRISAEVQQSSQAMDDIIWSVNSRNDTLEETLARMRRFAAELFDGTSIKYHLQLDESIEHKKIIMEQRRDIFLMYKEMLHNLYKHASAKEAWITVNLDGNQLYMQVKDDGKGFEGRTNSHRNGLSNLVKRARKWNGRIGIKSSAGKGTQIDIVLTLSG